jgi:hypothetical protein
MGKRGGVYRVLLGKPEEKRQRGRQRCRGENIIKIDLKEVESGEIDWIELAEADPNPPFRCRHNLT